MSCNAPRARQVDIVEVDADTLLISRDRILLADAADEGRERGVRCARRLQSRVRDEVREARDVLDAGLLDLRAGESAHRTGHVLDQFFTTARGHDDPLAAHGCVAFRRARRFGRSRGGLRNLDIARRRDFLFFLFLVGGGRDGLRECGLGKGQDDGCVQHVRTHASSSEGKSFVVLVGRTAP
jgi:hypothetical protein